MQALNIENNEFQLCGFKEERLYEVMVSDWIWIWYQNNYLQRLSYKLSISQFWVKREHKVKFPDYIDEFVYARKR